MKFFLATWFEFWYAVPALYFSNSNFGMYLENYGCNQPNQTTFLDAPPLPIELLHTKLHTYIRKKQKTLLHAMLAIIFLIVFVTHFQLLLIQMPLRCVFLSEHNKSSYLPPAPPTFFYLPFLGRAV